MAVGWLAAATRTVFLWNTIVPERCSVAYAAREIDPSALSTFDPYR